METYIYMQATVALEGDGNRSNYPRSTLPLHRETTWTKSVDHPTHLAVCIGPWPRMRWPPHSTGLFQVRPARYSSTSTREEQHARGPAKIHSQNS